MSPRLKQAINASVLIAGIGFCLISLVRLQRRYPLDWSFTWTGILEVIACAAVGLGAMALAWRHYMKAFLGVRLSGSDALYQACVMLVGKYVPVMIGGFLARISANAGELSPERIVVATMVEQVGAMGAALLVGCCCFAFALAPPLAPTVLACAVLAIWFAPNMLSITLRMFGRVRRIIRSTPALVTGNPEPQLVRRALVLQVLQWIALAGFVGGSVALAAPHLAWPPLLVVSGAYAIAVVVGIAVFFLPGGIGAREAVFVWLTSAHIGTREALQLALALRIAMSSLDLIAGAACIVLRAPLFNARRP